MLNKCNRAISLLLMCCAVTACNPATQKNNKSQTTDINLSTNLAKASIEKNTDNNKKKSVNESYIELNFDMQTANKWWEKSTIYQIWVSSFYDSNNDGYGDVQGIIQKINYVKSLGVEAVLLSPIFPTTSYHGYNVTNYKSINTKLGSLTDFNQLVAKAHDEGIKVILDLPINHTSDQHPWFLQSQQNDETYADYYVWSKTLPKGFGLPWGQEPEPTKVWHTKANRQGWYYGLFGFSNPDLNFKNEAVKSEIKSVFKYWIDLGVDGFRIDAARHFVEEGGLEKQADTQANFELINELVAYVKSQNEEVFLIGETFTDIKTSSTYLKGQNSFDALFNFEFYGTIRDLYTVDALATYHNSSQDSVVKDAIFDIYKRINNYHVDGKKLYVFLNNHDVSRFESPLKNDDTVNRILASLTLLSPFNTTTYYGEELGLNQPTNYDALYQRGLMPWNDKKNVGFNQGHQPWVNDATLFPWQTDFLPWSENTQSSNSYVETQQNIETSLLTYYQKLIFLKQNDDVLSTPERMIMHPASANVWFVEYFKENSNRLIAINLNPTTEALTDIPQHLIGHYNELLADENYKLNARLHLLPGQTLILQKSTTSHNGYKNEE